jgi:GTPase SAR1 family protein
MSQSQTPLAPQTWHNQLEETSPYVNKCPDITNMGSHSSKTHSETAHHVEGTFKILFLGAEGCGKSTYIRQICNHHNVALKFDAETEIQLRHSIQRFLIASLKIVLQECFLQRTECTSTDAQNIIHRYGADLRFLEREVSDESLREVVCLASDDAIRTALSSMIFQDNGDYFLLNSQRICTSDYTPTQVDLIHFHQPTLKETTILKIVVDQWGFDLIDTPGSVDAFHSWVAANPTPKLPCVVFFASLADYDISTPVHLNLLQHSINFFGQVLQMPQFDRSAAFLVLTKRDIFESKLRKSPFKSAWPSYSGSDQEDEVEVESILAFIKAKFYAAARDKPAFTHTITTTQSNMIEASWDPVRTTLTWAKLDMI